MTFLLVLTPLFSSIPKSPKKPSILNFYKPLFFSPNSSQQCSPFLIDFNQFNALHVLKQYSVALIIIYICRRILGTAFSTNSSN